MMKMNLLVMMDTSSTKNGKSNSDGLGDEGLGLGYNMVKRFAEVDWD
jgi:hypothetical protein